MQGMVCRVLVTPYGKVEFSSVVSDERNMIETDQKFGFLTPINGTLSYSITNRDGEISEKGVKKAVQYALKEWSLYVPIKFVHVPENGHINVRFNSEDEDDILTPNTLAYMYYPLGGGNNGKCVVNTRYYWTNHGEGIDMHYIDPIHYPEKGSGVKGKTWDLDQVLRHEFGHGVFGLPHDPHANNIMSSNYGMMHEHLQDRDISRARAKAGTREMKPHILKRWLRWIFRASDRTY